jgi:hypothetical protein
LLPAHVRQSIADAADSGSGWLIAAVRPGW